MLIDELVINLARGSEAEDLSRSIVEHGLDVGEFLGRDGGQVGAFGGSSSFRVEPNDLTPCRPG